ncbi:unnamed protein product, partial [Ascophyllum nodosum]
RWSLRCDRGPRRSNRGERKYGEEGIEHENDREESKEETVENETVDAVVNTRGDYAGQEGAEHESDREQPLVPSLGSLARESWLGTTIARRAGRDHFLFSYSHGHRGRKLSSVYYLPVGGGVYVGNGFGSVIFCLPRTNTTMPSRVQRELSS